MPWSAVTYIAESLGRFPAICSASLSTCDSWLTQAAEATP